MDGLVACAIALVVGFVGSMPVAGPIAVLALCRAADKRFGDALRIALGAALAEAIYAGVAFWGFATFLARWKLVVLISHGASAVLLIGLGTRFLFWRSNVRSEEPDRRAGTVLLGFSISALNPTLLVTWSAIVAFFCSHDLGRPPAIIALPFGLCAGSGVAAWFVCLVALLRKLGQRIPKGAFLWSIRVMGLVLIVLGGFAALDLTHAPVRAR